MLYELVKRCNHKKINVCLDFAHANISKTPIDEWFNKLKPYIKHIHLNDNDGLVD
jgi:sugar phosphate isomerase/epimerase